MSLSNPRRRLLQSATSLLPQSHFPLPLSCPHLHQRRTAMKDYLKNPFKSRRKTGSLDPNSPEFRARMEAERGKRQKEQKEAAKPQETRPLAPGNIFDALPPPKNPFHEKDGVFYDKEGQEVKTDKTKGRHRSVAWQQKMVIRDVRNGGRMTRAARLAKTERSHLCKSEFFETSIKKLFPLANQIVGKPLTEAMVQMRFSKKKAAQDVLKHLEFARNEAIVKRGMGLGRAQALAMARRAKQQTRSDRQKAEDGQKTIAEGPKAEEGQQTSPDDQKAVDAQQTSPDVPKAEEAPEPLQQEERLLVEDKTGKKRIVTDRTAMYVDEAWVGRGEYRSSLEPRARGRAYRLKHPQTSISVVLKEEATRIRQADDREVKRLRKKVWVALPDRPVTAQRQYPLW